MGYCQPVGKCAVCGRVGHVHESYSLVNPFEMLCFDCYDHRKRESAELWCILYPEGEGKAYLAWEDQHKEETEQIKQQLEAESLEFQAAEARAVAKAEALKRILTPKEAGALAMYLYRSGIDLNHLTLNEAKAIARRLV